MQWQDVGYLLSVRSLGEAKVIATYLTREHGPTAAMARVTKKLGHAPFQPGNYTELTWYGRLSEQLGRWGIEVQDVPAVRFMDDQLRMLMLSSACLLVQTLLPERNACPKTYDNFEELLRQLELNQRVLASYCLFELKLVEHLGFGLDLRKCAATGSVEDLVYISPKTGRAVSQGAGQAYHDKLFPLLPWYLDTALSLAEKEALQVLRLTQHFLTQHALENTNLELPPQRSMLMDKLACNALYSQLNPN